MKGLSFLSAGLTASLTTKEVKEQSDLITIPLLLVMKGLPIDVVNHATYDELRVYLEAVNKFEKTDFDKLSTATAYGIGQALGGSKK